MLTGCLVFISLFYATLCAAGNPVILIPGDGGTQLMGKLTGKPNLVHSFCSNYTTDYFPLWLNLELLVPYVLDCTVDNLKLVIDPMLGTTQNSPGVDISLGQFGDTEPVEWLDISHLSISSYFAPLVNELVDNHGYKRGKDVLGAAYDFRRAPNELQVFFRNLTRLFENSYKTNGKPALAVAHSLGNMVFTYFMSRKPQSWKDKYVVGYVALSAPLAGAAKLFRLFASGDTLGVDFGISALDLRLMQRTFPSSAFLLPYASEHFWDKDFPFIITPTANYSISNINQLAKDLKYDSLFDLRALTGELVNIPKMHPGVPVYCIHGWNIPTPLQFTYTGSMFPDSQPYVTYGKGDGTVNSVSLEGCDIWKSSKWKFDHHYVHTGGEHLAIMATKEFLDYVINILKLNS